MNFEEIQFFSKHGIKMLNTIACGGYGQIFHVFVNKYNSEFALKKIPIKSYSQTEVECMLSIDDPHIVHLYAHYHLNGYVYLLMELCTSDLDKVVKYKQFICKDNIKHYTKDIIRSIKACHDRKIAHCDIKPSNFLIDKYDRVKISDFGLSSIKIDYEKASVFKGTKLFMAPEIFQNKEYDPFIADIWSIGVTIYFIATRQYPFLGKDEQSLKQCIMSGVYNPDLIEDIELREVIQKCLDIDPATRINCVELLQLPYFLEEQQNVKSTSNFPRFMVRSTTNKCPAIIRKPKVAQSRGFKPIAPASSLTALFRLMPKQNLTR